MKFGGIFALYGLQADVTVITEPLNVLGFFASIPTSFVADREC